MNDHHQAGTRGGRHSPARRALLLLLLLAFTLPLSGCGGGRSNSAAGSGDSSSVAETAFVPAYNDLRIENGRQVTGTVLRTMADIAQLVAGGAQIARDHIALFTEPALTQTLTEPCDNAHNYTVSSQRPLGGLTATTVHVSFGAHNGDNSNYCLIEGVAVSGSFDLTDITFTEDANGNWSLTGRVNPVVTRHDGPAATLLKDIRNPFTVVISEQFGIRTVQVMADIYGIVTTVHDPRDHTYHREVLGAGFTLTTVRSRGSYTLDGYGALRCSYSGSAQLSIWQNSDFPLTWRDDPDFAAARNNSALAPQRGWPESGVVTINQTGLNQSGRGSSVQATVTPSIPPGSNHIDLFINENTVTVLPDGSNNSSNRNARDQAAWPTLLLEGVPVI